MKDNFLTAKEASKKIGISKERMARFCREGRLADCFQKGKIWLIPINSLEAFNQARRMYRPGRPRQNPLPSIFWRENQTPGQEAAIQILLKRSPHLIPKLIQKSVAWRFARSGRTRLERIVRRSLIQGLYEQS